MEFFGDEWLEKCNCAGCRYAKWESESGAKDCGLPAGTMNWIDGCEKEAEAEYDEEDECCTCWREIDEFDYDYYDKYSPFE